MAYRKSNYVDMEKLRATRNRGRKRYYQKTAIYTGNSIYTISDCEKILAHIKPDTELSAEIHHSVQSIQTKRCKLKAKLESKKVEDK